MYGIAKSKLPLAARIVLCIVVALAFIALLLGVIVLVAAMQY